MTLSLSRRRFLAALGATALPSLTLPGFARAAGVTGPGGHILVLIELAGGNDGLNTVVPITDPAYRGLRPEIGIGRAEGLGLDADTALHPAMRPFAKMWEAGELRIVEGVGYPDPNRSHFRSIEIWNSGLGAEALTRRGWLSEALEGRAPGADADGVSLGGGMGPMEGPGRFTTLTDEWLFRETLSYLPGQPHAVRPEAGDPLSHVLATYEQARLTGSRIEDKLAATRERRWGFPETRLGQQLRVAARLLDAGVEVPALKVVQDGYDTHEGQPEEHAYLLGELAEAVGAFRRAMQRIGLWDRVVVMTYSEFGRTARENASGGTDHGTAAPLFVAGGAVAGGFGGTRCSLTDLEDGEMRFTTDYRAIYDAALRELWGLDETVFAGTTAAPLRLLRTG